MLFRILRSLFRLLILKPGMTGLHNIQKGKPAVFIANHLGSFGPVIFMTFSPVRCYPWVTHEITDLRYCPDYLVKDFLEPELKLKPPLSRIFALLISLICVPLMRHIGAIPVNRNSRLILAAMDKSVSRLKKGQRLLVFPEKPGKPYLDFMNDFDSGFAEIGRRFRLDTGADVLFYPVGINKKVNTINVGKGRSLDPALPYNQAKNELMGYLKTSVVRLYLKAAHGDP